MNGTAGRAIFLGAGIHCGIGADPGACLQALRKQPGPPQSLCNEITDRALAIPYMLLCGKDLGDSFERLYGVAADIAEQALAKAALDPAQRARAGLFVGSSSFDICVQEDNYRAELSAGGGAISLRDSSIGTLAARLAGLLELRGPEFSFNTACTASANALVAAIRQVESGLLEHALVLGVELYNDVSALGFHGLGLLTESVMTPFDANRDGLVLGEGVSALVIGRATGSRTGGFYLRGSASTSDTHSITASNPDGSTIADVMRAALYNAAMTAGDVDAVKVHGTASLSNDEAEAAGMHQVFDSFPPVCALKPHIGHTLGACGLNELVLFCAAVEAGFLVATPGIGARAGDLGVTLNQEPIPVSKGTFMLNYFGFGGNNASLLVSNEPCPNATAAAAR